MSAVDGLLLSGGGDLVSLLYGEEPHIATLNQDPVRDGMEFEALRIALDAGLPVLAICRGMEVLNVALGGTLVQDIPSKVPDAIQHYTHARDTVLSHTIDIEEGTRLARVLGPTSTPVNSWHHQGVGDVGKGLRVNSRARDGVVEGIEADDDRPVLAVQFHPEDCAEDYPVFQRLFDWLVAEAAGKQAS
jgi:putative glutamine amidotransferase